MKVKAKTASVQPFLLMDSEVVRRIRQHARSSSSTEICGVLIGQDKDNRIEVTASIQGENAEQAGAHVTFTQDTWEHIYAVKDKKFPNERIVGWYHSHPGFGIFLSEHDLFIHKNFFSSPGQVAWVYDPHSDEEGCFGWVNGRIERLTRIAVQDAHGGERVEGDKEHASITTNQARDVVAHSSTEPTNGGGRVVRIESIEGEDNSSSSLEKLVERVFFSLTLLILGGLISWYLLPHTVLVPVVIDPSNGKLIDVQTGEVVGQLQPRTGGADQPNPPKASQPAPNASGTKGDNASSK
jgi:proteasome lid subunit RPN8/RPN11